MNSLKTRIDRAVWDNSVHLWFYERHESGGISVSSNLTMQTIPVGQQITAEPIRLEQVAAQELMDQLWQAGLRPSEGSGGAGSLAATERHLADMRALVFKTEPKA